MRTPRGSIWIVAGVFVVVGCYVGGLAVAVLMLMEFGRPVGLNDLLLLPLAALLGYPFGMIPALLTGVLSGAISAWVRSKILWVMAATLAGFVFSVFTVPEPGETWGYFGPVGAVAAFVSALVALNGRPRWSN